MAEPSTILNFLRSFGNQWLTRMSGPLTVPFAIASFFVPQTWLKGFFIGLSVLCAAVSSYGVWSQERNARIVAEAQKAELECPPDRPKISFLRWGQVENETGSRSSQHGFYLANDGGAALEVSVEPFSIDEALRALSATVARIEGGTHGFAPIWLENQPMLARWGLDAALELVLRAKIEKGELRDGQPLGVPVSVTYRDFNDLWYRSVGELIYIHGRIEFTAVQQKHFGHVRPSSM